VLNVASGSRYAIALNTNNRGAGGKIGVYVDGVYVSTIDVPQGANMVVAVGTVPLSPGLHGLLLKAMANATPGGDCAGYLNSIILTSAK